MAGFAWISSDIVLIASDIVTSAFDIPIRGPQAVFECIACFSPLPWDLTAHVQDSIVRLIAYSVSHLLAANRGGSRQEGLGCLGPNTTTQHLGLCWIVAVRVGLCLSLLERAFTSRQSVLDYGGPCWIVTVNAVLDSVCVALSRSVLVGCRFRFWSVSFEVVAAVRAVLRTFLLIAQ